MKGTWSMRPTDRQTDRDISHNNVFSPIKCIRRHIV